MVLTEDKIRQGLTKGVGINNRQFKILGIENKSGWLKELIGKEIDEEIYQNFLDAKTKPKDAKTPDEWSVYIRYLADWVKSHRNIKCKGMSPLTYKQFVGEEINQKSCKEIHGLGGK